MVVRAPLRRTRRVAAVAILLAALAMPLVGAASAEVAGSRPQVSTFLVQLAEPPVAGYRGGRSDLRATKPARGEKIDVTNRDVQRYAAHLDGRHTAAMQRAGVSESARLYDYRYSYNGFAAQLTPAQARRLQADPEVRSVEQDSLRRPHSDNTPAFLGLDQPGGLWERAGHGRAGENVVIGIIDTGVWPEHPSLSDQTDLADRPGRTGKRSLAYGAPPASWHGTCQAGELWSADDCNNKLIGARYFLAGFGHFGILRDEFASARDADGHGTHTASTAGGNSGVDPQIFGRDLGVGTLSGMAPRARLAAYKACWEGGCAVSDLVAAIDAAVADGVDVINYSIGSSQPALLGPDEVAFLFASEAGVFVATSAGNAGPGPGTVGSPASAPWVTAVAASTHDRTFQGAVVLGNGARYTGASVTPGLPSAPLVDGERAGSRGCLAGALDRAAVEGRIVLCAGQSLRAAKSRAVAAAGGVGMILHSAAHPVTLFSDNHFVPTVHVTLADGLAVREYLTAAGSGASATLQGGTATRDAGAPDVTHFSSRGPNGASGDVLKPDVTAPGMQVLAGGSPAAGFSAPGQLFQAISGTSMSSPHVAGVAALLVQAHRDWTPAMLRSALMTTAHQQVDREDGTTPADPFDVGAGHIQPNPATDPGLVYDNGLGDHVAFLCGADALPVGVCTSPPPAGFGVQPIDPSDLNLASLSVAELAGSQTITRRVTNVGAGSTYTSSVEAPPGVDVVVEPPTLTLGPGATGTYTVTFTSTSAAALGEWAFGSLTWRDGTHQVRSPLVVRPVPLRAPGEVAYTGTSGTGTWDVTFGYSGPFDAQPLGLVPAQVERATVADDPANDINVALATGVGLRQHEVLVAPGTEHLRFALFDEETDGEDDLDLYLFDPAGEFVSGSGSPTSAEQVDAAQPAPGLWLLVVHGWQTDGSDATYDLSTWRVPGVSSGNLTATAPAVATLGEQGTVDAAWSGLSAATRYLGAVRYVGPDGPIDRTLLRVTG